MNHHFNSYIEKKKVQRRIQFHLLFVYQLIVCLDTIFNLLFTEIERLMEDMHTSTNRILEMFRCNKSNSGAIPSTVPDDVLATNPPRLCYVAKQAIKESIVGKMLL